MPKEFTGKTVEDATAAAAKSLGVPEEQLKVKVLEQGKGLFGKGNVRISAEVVEAKAPKAAKSPAKAAAKPAKAAKEEPPAAEEKPAKAARGSKTAKAGPKEEAKAEEKKPAKTARGKSRAVPETPAGEPPPEPAEEVEVVATQVDADRILATVLEVVASAGFEVKAHVASMQGRYVNVELDGQGKELGYLVGKNGEVLNALQYLLNIISSQKAKTGVRLTLDANNYRQRREQALSKYAEEIASEVAKRKEEAVLDPLPAFERRIIHKALAGIRGVTTYSEGEEPNRRVVIGPVD